MLVCPYVMRRDFLHNQGDFAANRKRIPLFSVRRSEIWARDEMLIEKEALYCSLLIKTVARLSPQPHPRPPNAYLLPKNNA